MTNQVYCLSRENIAKSDRFLDLIDFLVTRRISKGAQKSGTEQHGAAGHKHMESISAVSRACAHCIVDSTRRGKNTGTSCCHDSVSAWLVGCQTLTTLIWRNTSSQGTQIQSACSRRLESEVEIIIDSCACLVSSCTHKINFREINSHMINSYNINFS